MTEFQIAQQTLLTLAMEGGDRNRIEVAEQLRNMTAGERAELRQALARLDSALDEVAFERMLQQTKKHRRASNGSATL